METDRCAAVSGSETGMGATPTALLSPPRDRTGPTPTRTIGGSDTPKSAGHAATDRVIPSRRTERVRSEVVPASRFERAPDSGFRPVQYSICRVLPRVLHADTVGHNYLNIIATPFRRGRSGVSVRQYESNRSVVHESERVATPAVPGLDPRTRATRF